MWGRHIQAPHGRTGSIMVKTSSPRRALSWSSCGSSTHAAPVAAAAAPVAVDSAAPPVVLDLKPEGSASQCVRDSGPIATTPTAANSSSLATTASSGTANSSRAKSRRQLRLNSVKAGLSALIPIRRSSLKFADSMPDASSDQFLDTEPVFSKKLPGLTIPALKDLLQVEPSILDECMKKDIAAYDLTPAAWQPATASPNDTLVRSIRYKMPVPADVPSAARAVIKIPEYCTCRTFSRLRTTDTELDLTFQTISVGLPFGENVRLQVANSFVPYTDAEVSGLLFRRWIVVVWTKELPWSIRFLKGHVLSQIMQSGKESAAILASMLEEQILLGI